MSKTTDKFLEIKTEIEDLEDELYTAIYCFGEKECRCHRIVERIRDLKAQL